MITVFLGFKNKLRTERVVYPRNWNPWRTWRDDSSFWQQIGLQVRDLHLAIYCQLPSRHTSIPNSIYVASNPCQNWKHIIQLSYVFLTGVSGGRTSLAIFLLVIQINWLTFQKKSTLPMCIALKIPPSNSSLINSKRDALVPGLPLPRRNRPVFFYPEYKWWWLIVSKWIFRLAFYFQ